MAWALAGTIVTQSGTDADLSGLSAIAGVTTSTINNRKIYNIGVLSLRISGTLTINPRTEQIVSGTTTTHPTFASSAATANLTIGQSVTQSGAKVFTIHPWFVGTIRNTITYNFNVQNFNWQAGTFTWHEGTAIFPNGASWGAGTNYASESDGAATITINEGAALQGAGYAGETQFHVVERNAVLNGLRIFGLSNEDLKLSLCRLRTAPKLILNGSYGLTSFTAGVRTEFLTLRDYKGTAMFGDARFWDGCRLRFVNSDLGTAHIVREHVTQGSRQGIAEFRQELTITTKTSAGVAIGGAISYLKDVTNVNRVNYTFTAPTIDYTPDNTYIISHNATTGIGTYTTSGGILVGVVARTTDGAVFPFDRRGNADSSADLFTIHTWAYGQQYATNTRALKGNGGTIFDATLVTDSNVTLSETAARAKLASSFTVNTTTKTVTVTAASSYDDIYDALKAYKCTATATNLETPSISTMIVSASGSRLTAATGWTLVVNAGVSVSAGTKFNALYFDTITNNGTITGAYETTAGAFSYLTVSNVVSGMVVKVLNSSTGATIASGTATTTSISLAYTIPSGQSTLSATVYVGKATGQTGGYYSYSAPVTLAKTLTTSIALPSADSFYGRSSGRADRANVAVTWNTTTGVPSITLSADTSILSVYDVVCESHATIANVTYQRPTTTDGQTYQFGAANFSGAGRLTGSTQIFTTGTFTINSDLILNNLNSINVPANSFAKVIKVSDGSVVRAYSAVSGTSFTLNLPSSTDYEVYLKSPGCNGLYSLQNSGTGKVITLSPVAHGYYNAATNISTITPKITLTNDAGVLDCYFKAMQLSPAQVCAVVDWIQQQEVFADVSLTANTANILWIDSQFQISPTPARIRFNRDATLVVSDVVFMQVYFNSGNLYPDVSFTPRQVSTGLFVESYPTASGTTVLSDTQVVDIVTRVWQNTTRTLTTATVTPPTVAEIVAGVDASTVLAKKSHIQTVNDGVKKASLIVPHTTNI